MSPRGQKCCPECETATGPRTKICQCGHVFIPPKPAAFPVPTTPWAKGVKRTPPKLGSGTVVVPTPNPTVQKLQDYSVTGTIRDDNSPLVVRANDKAAILKFAADLKQGVTDSEHNGGLFTVFLHHKHGTLAVEVGLPLRLKGKS